jgi:hypothetical protein
MRAFLDVPRCVVARIVRDNVSDARPHIYDSTRQPDEPTISLDMTLGADFFTFSRYFGSDLESCRLIRDVSEHALCRYMCLTHGCISLMPIYNEYSLLLPKV